MMTPNLQVMTVLGPVDASEENIVDAHNHLWIDRLPGVSSPAPVLDQKDRILAELRNYLQVGGDFILDCQPGICGRNGNRLAWLSKESSVQIIGCAGFHLKRYYPPDTSFWRGDTATLADHFIKEITQGMQECPVGEKPIRAGFIKIAIEAQLEETPQAALEAAAIAAAQTGAAIEIHTEKGAQAEEVLNYLISHHVKVHQIVLCHMDKRPDFELHKTLAQAGVLLEYDTFYRPKYQPESHLWPLIEKMVAAGFERSVALATDMAETHLWKSYGGEPGLTGFLMQIRPRLLSLGIPETSVKCLMGKNILQRLSHVAI